MEMPRLRAPSRPLGSFVAILVAMFTSPKAFVETNDGGLSKQTLPAFRAHMPKVRKQAVDLICLWAGIDTSFVGSLSSSETLAVPLAEGFVLLCIEAASSL
jgi:hypothetical protein